MVVGTLVQFSERSMVSAEFAISSIQVARLSHSSYDAKSQGYDFEVVYTAEGLNRLVTRTR